MYFTGWQKKDQKPETLFLALTTQHNTLNISQVGYLKGQYRHDQQGMESGC